MTTFHQDSIFRYFPSVPSPAQPTDSVVAPHSSHLHHVSMSPQPQSQARPPGKLRSNSINSISTDGQQDSSSHHGKRAKSSRPKHSWTYIPVDPAEDQVPPPTATRLEKELHSSFTSNFLAGTRRRTRPGADNKFSYNTASDVTSTAPSSHTEESVYSSKSSNTAVSPASSPAPPAAATRKRKDSVAASGDPSSHVSKKIKTSSSSSSATATAPAPAVVSPPPPPPKPAEEKPQTRFPGLFPNGLPPSSNKENAAQPKSPGLVSPYDTPGSGGNSAQKSAQQLDTSTKTTSLTSVDAAQKRKRSASPSSPSTNAMPKKKKTWTKKAQYHHSTLQQHVTASSSASSSAASRTRYPTDQQLAEQLEEIMLAGLRAGPAAYESMEQYRAAAAAEAAWQEGDRQQTERMLGNPSVRSKLLRLRELDVEIAAEQRGEVFGEMKKKKKGKNPANKGIGRGNWKRKPKISEPVVDESDEDGGVGDEEGVDGE